MKNRTVSQITLGVIILATLAVYWQVGGFEFLNYDDEKYVTENPYVRRGWSLEGIKWAATSRLHHHWHPVTWLSHMTDVQVFGMNPGWHHRMNLLLHLLNTLLLYWALRRMTGSQLKSAAVALLFALHPLHVETVAWISDRKDILCALFWFLTLGVYAHYVRSPGPVRYAGVFALFLMGLLAKSMAVALPFILLLMDYWPLKRFSLRASTPPDSPGAEKKKRTSDSKAGLGRLLLEKAGFFIIVFPAGLLAMVVMGGGNLSRIARILPDTERILRAIVFYGWYLVKTVWPTDLAVPYPHLDLHLWQILVSASALAAISAAVVWLRRTRPYLIVGWLWFLISLSPVIGLIKIGPQNVADRYTYLPLVGLFVMGVWGISDLLAGWRYRERFLYPFCAALLAALILASGAQTAHWESSETLFTHTLKTTRGNYVAHNNLGSALMVRGKVHEAIEHFRAALRLRPSFVPAANNLASALIQRGQYGEAVAVLQKALQRYPRFAEGHSNLGYAYLQMGDLDAAARAFSTALELKPRYAFAHVNLGVLFARKGQYQAAEEHFAKALSIDPDDAETHYNMARTLMLTGQTARARRHLSQALRLRPEYAKARQALLELSLRQD